MAAALTALDHGRLGHRVEAAHRALVDPVQIARPRPRAVGAGGGVAQADDVADDREPEVREQELGQRAGGHPGRRLPGRGPLEDVTGVVEAVLQHARQVGVAGAGLGEDGGRRTGIGRHLLGPLGPLGVGDHDGHRRAEGAAVADTADQGDLVGLEAHAGAPPVAQPASGQLVGDVGGLDRQAGGQALDDDDQGAAVRLAGSQKAQHVVTLLDRCRGSFPSGASYRVRRSRCRPPARAKLEASDAPGFLLGHQIGQVARDVGVLIEVVAGAHPVVAVGDGERHTSPDLPPHQQDGRQALAPLDLGPGGMRLRRRRDSHLHRDR